LHYPPNVAAGEYDPRVQEISEAWREAPGTAFDAPTLCAAFLRTAAEHLERPALRTPGGAQELSWRDYRDRVARIAASLQALGLQAGDTIALLLANRPEAELVDTAAMHLRAIPFSIYNTSAPEQAAYMLGHAGAKAIVTEERLAEVAQAAADSVGLEHVIVVDDPRGGIEALFAAEPADLDALGAVVRPDDVATLIYTSGTTGPPKAVELTHENLMWELRIVQLVYPQRAAGRGVSYLPMAHLADRATSHYDSLVTGACVTFVADLANLFPALVEVHPTIWGAVPRVWEKLKAGLEVLFASDADEHARADRATALERSLAAVREGAEPDAQDIAKFADVLAAIGLDSCEVVISGAAPIAPEVLEFFAAIGLAICEIWGMSETSLLASGNPPDAIRIGTVGPPLPGIEAQLAADGELLVRGPTIMRGYRGEPERTSEAIDEDGWLHTGDVAEFDDAGYLRIVDRKKELIINSGGKNMSPSNIENHIKAACPIVGSAIAIGDRRPYNTALVVLDPVAAGAFAAQCGIDPESDLAANPEVLVEVAAGIERANRHLARIEQIKRHTVLDGEWQPGGHELTPTMKLRRRPIVEKYAAEIEAMYA
jgi:long-subunit acyl-CoA synthetase (AMP-forming)